MDKINFLEKLTLRCESYAYLQSVVPDLEKMKFIIVFGSCVNYTICFTKVIASLCKFHRLFLKKT